MLIKYTGEYSREARSYGCSKCGTGRSISGQEVYKTSYRTYFDGRLIVFHQDQPVRVDDVLGKFLLTRKYTDKQGNLVNSFEEVRDESEGTWADENVTGEETRL